MKIPKSNEKVFHRPPRAWIYSSSRCWGSHIVILLVPYSPDQNPFHGLCKPSPLLLGVCPCWCTVISTLSPRGTSVPSGCPCLSSARHYSSWNYLFPTQMPPIFFPTPRATFCICLPLRSPTPLVLLQATLLSFCSVLWSLFSLERWQHCVELAESLPIPGKGSCILPLFLPSRPCS